MRHTVTEITKGYSSKNSKDYVYLMVTWEWNNGWNLVSSRRATSEEITTLVVDKPTEV